jgi:CSLREA domain-containing protein
MTKTTLRVAVAALSASALVAWGGQAIALPVASAGLVTFVVNALNDEVDANPGDGVCQTASGTCTLRAAIQEADASLVPSVILLPAGHLDLTIPTQWFLPSPTADLKTDPSYGELNIKGQVTILGAGADKTTIDANGIDRVFSVASTASLALGGVTVTGGDATVNDHTPNDIAIGGAILNTGALTLDRVALVHNRADGGGGVFSTPHTTITVHNSLIADNAAVEGGGLRLDGGGTIVNTTITGNSLFYRANTLPDEVTGYGGGIDHRGSGNVTIVNSTITNNHALKAGGGYNSGMGYTPNPDLTSTWPYRTTLLNTVIAGNTVNGAPENCHVAAMIIESRGHNLADDTSCFLSGPGDLPGLPPRLGPLAMNGGPTATQLPLKGSPLIDAGTYDGCPADDQRGVPRPQGPACDIGAVEVSPDDRPRMK